MPVIRTVFQVPQTDDLSEQAVYTYGSIAGSLIAIGANFHITENKGYSVTTPGPGKVTFEPGAWMLFCQTGVWPVTPVDVRTLKPGDGMLGFTGGRESDIYDAVLVLKYKPQVCGNSVRLVPNPALVHPRGIQFGITYASPPNRAAWKYLPTLRTETCHGIQS